MEQRSTGASAPTSLGGGSLPAQLTTFIGRRDEQTTIEGLLRSNRLLTLVGTGGSGKTRLAFQVATEHRVDYQEGVWWVDLARLSDPSLIPSAVAASLELKEVPGQPLADTLRDRLGSGRVLLVLDNCEHVVVATAELADDLLRSCRTLSILATSREPLRVDGEVAWRVPSLGLPPEVEGGLTSIASSDAVQLFLDRANRIRPASEIPDGDAAAVVEICRRVDGIPLAIELAAARVRMMTPAQIASGLEDRFRLLTGSSRTAPPRHRTLRASVDWSHDLLDEEERVVLRRLAVFAGGFTLDAAQAVCEGDGIADHRILDLVTSLVDRSLVQVGEGGTSNRYHLLETIRQYARERSKESGEEAAIRSRHLEHYLAMAERAEPEMEGAGLIWWLPILDVEHDNLRAAIDWSVEAGAADACLRLTSALWLYWLVRGHLSEGRRRFDIAFGLSGMEARRRGYALVGVAALTIYQGDLVATHTFAEEALAIARSLQDPRLEGRALESLGYAVAFLDPQAAPTHFQESLPLLRASNDGWFLVDALNGLGMGALIAGDLPGALSALEEGVSVSRETGNANSLAIGLTASGFASALQGRLEQACFSLEEGLAIARELRDRVFTSAALYSLAFVEAHRGEHEAADRHLEESVELVRDASPLMLSFALVTLGLARYARGDLDGSISALEEGLELARAMELPWATSWSLSLLGNVESIRGDLEAARSHVGEALAVAKSNRMEMDLPIDADARLARAAGDPERAEARHHDALAAARAADSILTVPMQLEALAGLATVGESFSEAARLFGAAEAARAEHGLVRYEVDRQRYEVDVGLLRDSVGEEELSALWAEGRAMSLEEAVAYASRGRGKRRRPTFGWASLTPTELEVVRHVAEGLTNPQIAERLFVSRSTVKVHLAHVFAKLGVTTRAELAAEATKREVRPSS